MNTDSGTSPSSRWVREVTGEVAAASEAERQVLQEVLMAMRRVRHGTLTLAVQDGKVVQLDVTEKKRF
ncbi:MAG: YezD family protein [bacterium]